jgi:hypothetical protein
MQSKERCIGDVDRTLSVALFQLAVLVLVCQRKEQTLAVGQEEIQSYDTTAVENVGPGTEQ